MTTSGQQTLGQQWQQVWQQVTLANVSPTQWGEGSYLHHIIGSLRNWRRGSGLMRWADEIGLVLAAIVFAIAPFVPTTVIGVFLIFCALYWLLLTLTDDAEAGTGMTPIHLLLLLYWWVTVLATVFSPVRMVALAEGLRNLTLFLMFFALLARILRSPRLRSSLITVYLLTALVVSVGGLRQAIFGAAELATWVDRTSTLAGTTRVYSFLGNPNLLAGYLLPSIVLSAAAVFAWRGWMPKALALMMWGMNSACLVLTYSRGSWLGFLVAGLVFAVLLFMWFRDRLPRFWRTWGLPLGLVVLVVGVAFAILAVPPLRDRFFSIFAGRDDSSNNFRINVWTSVIQMIKDHPILGIGPGNDAFNRIYPLYQEARFTALSAYSILLEVPVETGLLGLASFLWLLTVTLNQGWRQLMRLRSIGSREGFWLMGAIASLIGMFTQALFDTVLYRPQVNTLWWLMFALIASFAGWQSAKAATEPVAQRGQPEGTR